MENKFICSIHCANIADDCLKCQATIEAQRTIKRVIPSEFLILDGAIVRITDSKKRYYLPSDYFELIVGKYRDQARARGRRVPAWKER